MGGVRSPLSCSHRSLSNERFNCSPNALLRHLEASDCIPERCQRLCNASFVLAQLLLQSAHNAADLAFEVGKRSCGTLVSSGNAALQLA